MTPKPPDPVKCCVCKGDKGTIEYVKRVKPEIVAVPLPFGLTSRRLNVGFHRWLQTCDDCGHRTHLATRDETPICVKGEFSNCEIVEDDE